MSTVPEHAHDERAPNERPVDVVAPQHLSVTAPAGTGVVPLFATGEWNASQPGITAPIASATTVEQTRELLGAVDLKLEAETLEALDRASAWQQKP